MTAEENRKIAQRWFQEVWNDKRDETVRELFPASGVGYMEGPDGDYIVNGPEEFLTARAALLDAFPNIRVRIDDIMACGDDVAIRWSVAGTHAGAGLGFAPSMKDVAFRGMSWMKFANGKIVQGWDSWNQERVFAGLRSATAATAS